MEKVQWNTWTHGPIVYAREAKYGADAFYQEMSSQYGDPVVKWDYPEESEQTSREQQNTGAETV